MQNITSSIAFCMVLTGLWLSGIEALAQITPDDALSTESSVVVPDVMINGLPSDRIEGGAVRGAMLFHSFEDFNIGEGRGAYFSNPNAVNSIFSRVTGNNPSDILGTLGVLGNADLLFLNPNGILFGPTAKLDLRGSFTASTASEVMFSNGETFGAIASELPSLLDMNVKAPIGLVFENTSSGVIVNHGTLVTAADLTLSANSLNLQGQFYAGGELTLQAQDTVKIRDREQSPFIAASGEQLTVQGGQEVDILILNHPSSGLFSGEDMVLLSNNSINGDAHYWSGGNFRVEQMNGQPNTLLSPRDPIIVAANDVELGSYTGASLHILAGGEVSITGDIEINGVDSTSTSIGPLATAPFNDPIFREIILSDKATSVSIDGSNRPTLDIRAGVDWQSLPEVTSENQALFSSVNPNPTFAQSNTGSRIDISGNIRIIEPNGLVYLSNQFNSDDSSSSENIEVDSIFLDSPFFFSDAGSVLIDSRSDIVIDRIDASSSFLGDGGNIDLIANGDITTGLLNTSSAAGNGGDISINSLNGAIDTTAGGINSLVTTQFGFNAGRVSLLAQDDIAVGGIDSSGGAGRGGDIEIRSMDGLFKANNSLIFSGTFGSGESGDIKISADNVLISSGSRLLSTTLNSGDSGDILIRAEDFIEVSEESVIAAATIGSGNGGKIRLEAKELVLQNGGAVVTATFGGSNRNGEGNSGDIEIIASNSARIAANPSQGLFDVRIPFTDSILKFPTGLLSETSVEQSDFGNPGVVQSRFGNAGNIVIQTPKLLVQNGRGYHFYRCRQHRRGQRRKYSW